MNKMKLSIVIPAHNEEKRIARTLEDYAPFFESKYGDSFEIIVVLNACKDDTLGVVNSFKNKYKQIRHIEFQRGGKGFAIIEGFKVARGDVLGFTDADDSTTAEEFYKILGVIDSYSGAIGSRWMKGSIVSPKQPLTRRFASRGFNALVRIFFGIRYQDTQCGAKAFKREAITDILPKLGVTEWAFDIDLLYQMKKKGYKIKELPITWSDAEGSKLRVPRTTLKMFLAIVRLRLVNSPFSFMIKIYDKMPEWIKFHHRI